MTAETADRLLSHLAELLPMAVADAYGEFRRLDDPGMTAASRLARLDSLDAALAGTRTAVADARAKVIAEAVAESSTRQVAIDLGLSPSAVAKAVARARAST